MALENESKRVILNLDNVYYLSNSLLNTICRSLLNIVGICYNNKH